MSTSPLVSAAKAMPLSENSSTSTVKPLDSRTVFVIPVIGVRSSQDMVPMVIFMSCASAGKARLTAMAVAPMVLTMGFMGSSGYVGKVPPFVHGQAGARLRQPPHVRRSGGLGLGGPRRLRQVRLARPGADLLGSCIPHRGFVRQTRILPGFALAGLMRLAG